MKTYRGVKFMTGFINYLINGISLGSVYAIIALGYTMVYGIAKMLNFAHGDIIMVGSYVVFITTHSMGMPVFLSVLLSVIVCTVLGIVIERVAYKPLRVKDLRPCDRKNDACCGTRHPAHRLPGQPLSGKGSSSSGRKLYHDRRKSSRKCHRGAFRRQS